MARVLIELNFSIRTRDSSKGDQKRKSSNHSGEVTIKKSPVLNSAKASTNSSVITMHMTRRFRKTSNEIRQSGTIRVSVLEMSLDDDLEALIGSTDTSSIILNYLINGVGRSRG